jgi:uncharacterized membrane protein
MMIEFPFPLHPMVVHFPIALFMTALGLELLSLITKKESLHQSAVHIFIIAALLTPLVVRTGIEEAEELRLTHPVLDKHRLFALWSMWVSLAALPVLWLAKKEFGKYFRAVFLAFLIGAVSLVSLTGYNGGRMVYGYGVGIEK